MLAIYLSIFFLICGLLLLFLQKKITFFSKHSNSRLLGKIDHLLTLKELDKATVLINKLQKKGEISKELLFFRVKLLRLSHEFQRALKLSQWAAKRYPEELLFRVEEALNHLELNNPKEALLAFDVCEPILHLESELLALAKAYLLNHDFDRFWDRLEPMLQNNPSEHTYALAGDYYFEAKEFQTASLAYKQALELDPSFKQARLQLAACYLNLNQINLAEEIFKPLFEKDPHDVTTIIGLGSCFEKRGLFYKALHFYQTSHIWEKQDPRVYLRSGICALHIKRFTFAETYFKHVLEKEGLSAQVLSYLGLAYEGQNRFEEAESTYLEVTHKFENTIYGYRALAWMFGCGLSTQISYEDGLNFAYKALEFNQENHLWEILSACYARMGCYQEALKIQEKLAFKDLEIEAKKKRALAMRTLRQHLPLSTHLISRHLVA